MKIKISSNDLIFTVIFIFMVGFIAGLQFAPRAVQPLNIEGERVVKMMLPAVDSEGNGVVGILSTSIKPGTGKILVDTSKVLNYPDTQLSARIAAEAASNYRKINLDNIDITYTIDVNASIVEGPSAGASMAVSVLLALENRTSNGIAITGAINADGSIGAIGAAYEKAAVAKQNGAQVFLVPVGQSTTDITNRTRVCETRGGTQLCRIKYNSRTANIGESLNMTVHEVANIGEAYSYFTGEKV